MASSVDGMTESLIHGHHSKIYHGLHKGEIRLVTILRGQWSDKIHCQLHHFLLSDLPTYKALSYAWGYPRATRPILVNGCHFPVTVNLESVLRRIRRSDGDLIIWIDALCINQSNISERTEQVKLMHDIFTSTEEVIAYLGEAPCHSSKAMNISIPTSTTSFNFDDSDEDKLAVFRLRCMAGTGFDTLKDKGTKDYAFDVLCFLRLLSKIYHPNHFSMFASTSRQFIDSKYQRNLFEGLRQLMLSRWWNRIWVIQEIVVPKIVTIVYGSTMAPWNLFVEAAHWESRNRYSSTPISFPREYSVVLAHFSRVILDIEGMRKIWRNNTKSTLLPLLRQFSSRKASDDRDKVFALLSLARDETSIVPDYSLSVSSVFQNTVFNIIQNTRSLAVFAGDLGRKDRQDLPSWVPDWSATYNDLDRCRGSYTEKYNATNGCQVYLQGESDEELSGICQYLGISKEQFDKRTIQEQMETLHEIVRTPEWTKYLPNKNPDELCTDMCLAAVESFYTAHGRAVCLKTHSDDTIRLRGLQVDTISVTGEIAFSEDEVLSVLRSWAFLVANHFSIKPYDCTNTGLGDAFRRTICRDIIESTRGIKQDDHIRIANWLFQGTSKDISILLKFITNQGGHSKIVDWGSSMRAQLWEKLFRDIGELDSHLPPQLVQIPPGIDEAIRSATLGRTFFITKKGYIGLGPAKMRPGDYLYILMGGNSPFILRDSGFCKALGRRQDSCFAVIGDCYAHGLMDGETMGEFQEALDTARLEAYFGKRKLMLLQEQNKRYTYLRDLTYRYPLGNSTERICRKLRNWIVLTQNKSNKEGQWIVENVFFASENWLNDISQVIGDIESTMTEEVRSMLLDKIPEIIDHLKQAKLRAEQEIHDLDKRTGMKVLNAQKTFVYLV